MSHGNAPRERVLLDTPGLVFLGAFVFAIPICVYSLEFQMQRLVLILGALAAVTNVRHLRVRQVHPSMVCIILLWLWFYVGLLSNTDDELRRRFLLWTKYCALACAVSVVVRERVQITVVLSAMAVSVLFVAYVSQEQISETRDGLARAVQSGQQLGLVRTAGAFLNANQLAEYAVNAAVAAITLYVGTRRLVSLALCMVAAPCAGLLALYSGSRKAVLGLAIGLLFAALYKRRTGGVLGLKSILASMLLFGGGAAWFVSNPYIGRFSGEDASYQARSDLLGEAWALGLRRPLAGLGYGGFERRSTGGVYTHSTPFEMLCNGGVVALCLYIALWWAICRTALRCVRMHSERKELALLYGLACYVAIELMNALTSVTIEEPRYLIPFACVCGYLQQRDSEGGGCRVPQGRRRNMLMLRKAPRVGRRRLQGRIYYGRASGECVA